MKPQPTVDPRQQTLLFDGLPVPVTRDTEAMREYVVRQEQAKVEVLDDLDDRREFIIAAGKSIARYIARTKGTVTAAEVLASMRDDSRYADGLDKCDPRWTGCLFRGKEWEHVGEERLGSHHRPVWIWRLR